MAALYLPFYRLARLTVPPILSNTNDLFPGLLYPDIPFGYPLLTTTCGKSGFTLGPLSLFCFAKTALTRRRLLPSPLGKKLLGNRQVVLSFYCFFYLSPLPVVRASEGATARASGEKGYFYL